MINIQRICSDIKTLEFISAKSKWEDKIWYTALSIFFLSSGLCVTFGLRPYIYDNSLREYYFVIGAMPSFIFIPIIYYAAISYNLLKNKRLNNGSYVPFLMGIAILSISYEFFLSRTFDLLDVLAIILGTVAVFAIEEARSKFSQIIKKE